MDNKTTKAQQTYTADYFKADIEKAVFLENPHIDNLMTAFLHLASEFWVMRRRMMAMEKVLASAGAFVPEALDKYEPGGEEKAAWEAARDTFIKQTFDVFTRTTAPLPSKVPNELVPALKVSQ